MPVSVFSPDWAELSENRGVHRHRLAPAPRQPHLGPGSTQAPHPTELTVSWRSAVDRSPQGFVLTLSGAEQINTSGRLIVIDAIFWSTHGDGIDLLVLTDQSDRHNAETA